ncbi:MAG: hypothetical protein ACU826_10580 [Gammaproteobacteria bacterium]
MPVGISGMAMIPESGDIIVINDKGRLENLKSLIKPALMVLDFDAVEKIIPVSLKSEEAAMAHFLDKRWDAEALKCIQLLNRQVGCAVVSGKQRKLIWIVAQSTAQAIRGNFAVNREYDLGDLSDSVLSGHIPEDQQIEAIEIVEYENGRVCLLLLSQKPVLYEGRSGYPEYLLNFDVASNTNAEMPRADISILNYLPESICQFPEDPIKTTKISDIMRLENSLYGYLTCTGEKTDHSHLLPVVIDKSGVRLRDDAPALVVTSADLSRPPSNMKVEGVVCRNGRPMIAVDPDSRGGGVYELSGQFMSICS